METRGYRMKCAGSKQYVVFLIVTFPACAHSSAQFLDDFNGTSIATDPRAINGSFYSMENQGGKFSPALRFNLQK